MVTSNKIKNKKVLYFLSKEENMILQKTIEFNKNEIYHNLETVKKNKNIFIKSSSNIMKSTLITIVGV